MRKRLWDAEVQRRLPAALSKRPRWATGGVGAAAEDVGEEAEAEGGQWLGMWPILDPSALGAGKAVGDAPRDGRRWSRRRAVARKEAKGRGTSRLRRAYASCYASRGGLDGLFGLAC